MSSTQRIPVTVFTGYLGAGKTTLLNHLLTAKHGYKLAIIINEFGSVSIDNQIVVGADEEILELNNGCLCCRVRGDLVRSIEDLFKKRKRFDYILIETTGLADPSPIAHTFAATDLAEKLYMDGIVTVVDALNIEKELSDGPEASAQIAFADAILLNKADLVTEARLNAIERRIRSMNVLAKIYRTTRSVVDLSRILGIKAREVDGKIEIQKAPEEHHHHDHAEGHSCGPDCTHDHSHEHAHDHHHDHDHAHDHDHDHECGPGCDHEHHHHEEEHAHYHDEKVKSFVITSRDVLDLKKTEEWLGETLKNLGEDIYRCKGILVIKGMAKRVVFQGVQMLFEAHPDRLWKADEVRENTLVFIGRELPEQTIREGFQKCCIAV